MSKATPLQIPVLHPRTNVRIGHVTPSDISGWKAFLGHPIYKWVGTMRSQDEAEELVIEKWEKREANK